MQSFHEGMIEYLTSSFEDRATIASIEKDHPGFTERVRKYEEAVYLYAEEESDILLLSLLRESHYLSEMFEEKRIQRMRQFLQRVDAKKAEWADED